jgi:TRAP-type C4-dicarboxylate transport system permease large subunit
MGIGLELAIILGMLLIFMFMGSPVMGALGCTAALSVVFFVEGNYWTYFGSIAFQQGTSMNQLIPPMFILMAEFLSRGGIADDIYAVINIIMKRIRGGLAMATTLACTVFAALCGSSPATAAAIGRISSGAMTSRKYQKGFAIGTVAGAGTLGIMIPPSLPLVFFGILTETSIAKLLMAGLVPGLMISGLMIFTIFLRVRANPQLAGINITQEYLNSKKYKPNNFALDQNALLAELKDDQLLADKTSGRKIIIMVVPAFILILLVLGGMYSGACTAVEAAALGALGAFVIVILQKRLDRPMLKATLTSAARTSCMMMFMAIAGMSLSFVLAYLKIPTTLTLMVLDSGVSKYGLLIGLYVLWLIMGCLMDPGCMVVLTVPFLFQPLVSLGFDPIFIGIASTLAIEIGMITPPVGINLFILRANTDIEMIHIIKGALPYVVVLLASLVLITIFPEIVLFVPHHM